MNINAAISRFTDNSNFSVLCTINGIPDASVISTATFTIKVNETDSDVLIIKVVDIVDNPGVGQVENDGASTIGVVRFDFIVGDSGKLTPDIKYPYWIDALLDTGEVLPLEKGLIWSIQGSSHV